MSTTDVYCVVGTADGLQAPLGPFPDSQTAVSTVAQLIASSPTPRALLRVLQGDPNRAGLDGPDVLEFLTVNFDHGVTTTTEHANELTWDDVYPELLTEAGTLDIERDTTAELDLTLSPSTQPPAPEPAAPTQATGEQETRSASNTPTSALSTPPGPTPVKAATPRHSRGKDRRRGFGRSIKD